ncbi:MAG: hypothetical protein IKF80_09585 [Erysipelotrichaceae bacterium]|nr:hypothetical protein [Erysipelotrichaceae bacterium]
MNKNAIEINDDILDMITGGKVLEGTYDKIIQIVTEAKEKNYPRPAVRAMLVYAYSQFPEDFSDKSSLKDINEILSFFDQKWKEING